MIALHPAVRSMLESEEDHGCGDTFIHIYVVLDMCLMYVYSCVYIYIYMYVCMYLYVYIYNYICIG